MTTPSNSTVAVADTGDSAPQTVNADVVVKGRNVEVPDHFRIYVSEKLARSNGSTRRSSCSTSNYSTNAIVAR